MKRRVYQVCPGVDEFLDVESSWIFLLLLLFFFFFFFSFLLSPPHFRGFPCFLLNSPCFTAIHHAASSCDLFMLLLYTFFLFFFGLWYLINTAREVVIFKYSEGGRKGWRGGGSGVKTESVLGKDGFAFDRERGGRV